MHTSSNRLSLYAAVGPVLAQYDVDVDQATLVKGSSVTLPANVQYAWPHASKRYLYVASSDGAGVGRPGSTHHLCAFHIDPDSGALTPHGEPVALRYRPIHMCTDIASEHALIAYCIPASFSVHSINRDGSIGAEVKQSASFDTGVYPHQIRVAPSNATVILVTLGHPAKEGKPQEPGALKVFKYRDGRLSGGVSVAPRGGPGFGPRHLDFHPTKPWVYVSLAREHAVALFALNGDTLSSDPLFKKPMLREPANLRPQQAAGTIHMHPNGRFVYGCERADATTLVDGKRVFIGGENTIVTYAIDERTGEPTPIQHTATHGIHPRTFSIDPSGQLLIAANLAPIWARDGDSLQRVPASLDLYRIGEDGKLDFARSYAVDVGNAWMFWAGLV